MATKKPTPKFGKESAKESAKEERMEKKMSPAAYKKVEKSEGEPGFKKGGMVKGRKC